MSQTRHDLTGRTIAILATNGFEESELTVPKRALEEAGGTTTVVAPAPGTIQGLQHLEAGRSVHVDATLDEVTPGQFDAVLLPGGLFNPDELRTDPRALAFVEAVFRAGKPVAAICHGPQILISAGLVRGRTLTSVPSIRDDLENAGALWRDEAVVVDQGLVTSRTPADLEPFCARLVEEVAEGRRQPRAA